MDRSFLSQPEVIAASRKFVCVRLTTYENKDENDFLKAFSVTRSGEVENTVFTILSPDGKRQLARASRSARQTFGDAERMASTMERLSREFDIKKSAVGQLPELPRVANVRLAVNVAACDNQPLVLLFAKDEKARHKLEQRLTPLAWNEQFLGQFMFVSTSDARDLAIIEGGKPEEGILIVQPDRFGTKGKLLKQVAGTVIEAELVRCLKDGLAAYQRQYKTFQNHVRSGQQKGVFWETVLPVTDPQEARARERGRTRNPGQE
jgi:hypothetical protein